MANEIKVDGYVAGRTLTARVKNAAGQFWHIVGAAFEAYGAGGHAASSYDTAMTDKGGGAYRGTFPAGILASDGEYVVDIWDSLITTQAIMTQQLQVRSGAVVTLYGAVMTVSEGDGDHAVTVTIRTTGGTAVAGVRAWLSIDNNRDNMVTGTYTTNDSGQVTFYCDYATTYYLHGHLSGYQFASANFTPAAGSVSFTKDIASTVTASGSESDYAEAQLVRMIEEVRKWVDEPKLSGGATPKYSDDWIIRRCENVYALVLAEKFRQTQDPVAATISITPVAGTYSYIIPSTMGPIQAVYYQDPEDSYGYKYFYDRRGSHNRLGKGVWVEGNMLRLQDGYDDVLETLQVECWPNGCARLHCGTLTLNAAGTEATLGVTPYKGTRDRSVNAYAGSVLRIFNVTGTTVVGNLVQERVISSYNATTRVATLAVALDPIPTTNDGSIFYEIAPQIPISLDAILGMRVAWEIAAVEMPKKAPGILALYQQNLRHLRLEAWSSQLASAGKPNADANWNPAYDGNSF